MIVHKDLKFYCSRLRLTLILGLIILLIFSCRKNNKVDKEEQGEVSSYKTTEEILKDYELVWSDDFEGDTLDHSKWNYRAAGDERNYATVSEQTISVDGEGHLSIKVTQDDEGNYYVGQVGTEGVFETKYGYFETKAKMNDGIGPHVAFWLQTPEINKTNNDPKNNGVEIDIFEYHRETPDSVHYNLHWNGYGEGHMQEGVRKHAKNIDTGFHTFGLLWTEDRYIFYYDGEKTWETDRAVSQRKEYMILSTELTGFGGAPAEGEYPDQVVFDYVKVYKPK